MLKGAILKTWIYHETEQPKIINSDQLTIFLGDGWEESPIKFVKTTDFGVEPDNKEGVQALGESIQGIKSALNDQLNIEAMQPKELKEFALIHHGLEIKGNREKLLKQVRALIDDNSTRIDN